VRQALIVARLGKYNVGQGTAVLPQPRPAQVILVPGQVEDDASIRTGSPWISTNLGLLAAVRAAHPHAYILFKPHPDVVSGNRAGEVPADEALRFADVVVPEADVIACVEVVDEVHTMTSLAGFEALLRGKRVTCYGAPFYAGWGLTHDVFAHVAVPPSSDTAIGENTQIHPVWLRRCRKLTLDELVAATLLRYARYIHPVSRAPMDAGSAIRILQLQREKGGGGTRLRRNRFLQQLGKIKMWWLTTYAEYRLVLTRSMRMTIHKWLAKL
jgi:capsular polysaccharide export protein